MVKAVRGAISIEKNSPDSIIQAVRELIPSLLKNNNLQQDDLVHIFFSITDDITALNPATALRQFGYSDVPLFCLQEAKCDSSLPLVIRTLITFNTDYPVQPKPLYLGRTNLLRPDLAGK